jgi:hypothetical protein
MSYSASSTHSIAGLAMRLSSTVKFGAVSLTDKACQQLKISVPRLIPTMAHHRRCVAWHLLANDDDWQI